MEEEQLIESLSNKIWNKLSRPDSKSIQPFLDQLKTVEIDAFIVYNFLNHPMTSIRDLLLSIFPLWRNLGIDKWRTIFERLEGNQLAEYHMKVFADQYLGIDPGFESTKNVSISAIVAPSSKVYNSSTFIPTMSEKLRTIYEKDLLEVYDISLSDLVEVNERLTKSH